jgi:hypothetical protein
MQADWHAGLGSHSTELSNGSTGTSRNSERKALVAEECVTCRMRSRVDELHEPARQSGFVKRRFKGMFNDCSSSA